VCLELSIYDKKIDHKLSKLLICKNTYTKQIFEHQIETYISYIPQEHIKKKYDNNQLTVACRNC
jgi:hypothetical protein